MKNGRKVFSLFKFHTRTALFCDFTAVRLEIRFIAVEFFSRPAPHLSAQDCVVADNVHCLACFGPEVRKVRRCIFIQSSRLHRCEHFRHNFCRINAFLRLISRMGCLAENLCFQKGTARRTIYNSADASRGSSTYIVFDVSRLTSNAFAPYRPASSPTVKRISSFGSAFPDSIA